MSVINPNGTAISSPVLPSSSAASAPIGSNGTVISLPVQPAPAATTGPQALATTGSVGTNYNYIT